MSIRARIEDAAILCAIGRYEAALLCVLTALAATSRRRRPEKTTKSIRRPGKAMGDGEAFEAFLSDEMPTICRVKEFNVQYKGKSLRIEHVFYKWLRCSLAHEARLPKDIHFESDPSPGILRTAIGSDGSLTLSHGWIDGFTNSIVKAPENADQFGSPPAIQLPIYLPKIDAWIGGEPAVENPGQTE
jgi:hypothetical protein